MNKQCNASLWEHSNNIPKSDKSITKQSTIITCDPLIFVHDHRPHTFINLCENITRQTQINKGISKVLTNQ